MFWSKKEPSDKKSHDDFVVHLFKTHGGTMLEYAKRILNDSGLAEDAVSEAFRKIIHYRDKLRLLKPHEVKSYTIRIVHTTSYDFIKKKKQ